MNNSQQNFTIVVNWMEKGFGCAKNCSYCNWRTSPLLPNGPQSDDQILDFIRQCSKSFVTISGGADPLYKFEENKEALFHMMDLVRQEGFDVRIITREVEHIHKLKGLAKYISISLDDDVIVEIEKYKHLWEGLKIEYSMVLPPLPTESLVKLKPQYATIAAKLGKRLVLRENLNSVFNVDMKSMSFGHSAIVFVTKDICLRSRYLSKIDCVGYDIVTDAQDILTEINALGDYAIIFGGMVKHIVAPEQHLEYSDIDLIVTDDCVMNILKAKHGYEFELMSESDRYPTYYRGISSRAGKEIQVVRMNSMADAEKFVFNSQYDTDRVYLRFGVLQYDMRLDPVSIRHAIQWKIATRVKQDDLSLFSSNREHIERRHRAKLIKKNFRVIEIKKG